MSFAIFETGGKQYKASASKIIEIEKLEVEVGKTIQFKNVLLLNDTKTTERIVAILTQGKLMSSYIDAITNVRLVNGTLRMDLMVIDGQEDEKFSFSKKDELVMSLPAFSQALSTMKAVETELTNRANKAREEQQSKEIKEN